ncbi:MAG: deoxyribose-phosphate aldolase [Methylobacteriaceae bacterium]|nr:deoxyribose-phosphate aldolase [Methylobacteriaceae bacterium]
MIDKAARAIARRAIPLLDLTDLSDDCRPSAVEALCKRAVTPRGPVAAVCVWPRFAAQATVLLRGSGVRVATVINFPHGGEDVERAVEDAHEAVADGADEIDLVMPYAAFLRGETEVAREMIVAVATDLAKAARLKVILETGALKEAEAIAAASRLAIEAGADFLKTSTGKIAISATPAAAEVMLGAIKASSKDIGFKAAGGIRTVADAGLYLGLADRLMGKDWARPETFRFGASGLLDALLAANEGRQAATKSAY